MSEYVVVESGPDSDRPRSWVHSTVLTDLVAARAKAAREQKTARADGRPEDRIWVAELVPVSAPVPAPSPKPNEPVSPGEQDDYLTTEEVAKRFRTGASTVRYWRHARDAGPGGLPFPRGVRIGRRVLYPRAVIERYEAELLALAQ